MKQNSLRYLIVVGRRVYQTTPVLVTEESRKKAIEVAIERAKDPNVAWNNINDETCVYFAEKVEVR